MYFIYKHLDRMPKPDIFSLANKVSDEDFENVVKDAISRGININKQKRGSFKSLLHEAILAKNEHRAKILIEHGANVNIQDTGANTPLHAAVYRDLQATAELLLKNGADVNAQEFDENTPLHDAVLGNKENMAKLLVKYGADINQENDSGNTPLSIAERANDLKWIDLLKGETGRKEKEERERKEKEDRERKEKEDRERKEKEDRERKEKEDRERKEKEDRERKEKEARERKEKEARERKEKEDRQRKEKEDRQRKENEDRERKEKEDRERKMPSNILEAVENITNLQELDQVLTHLRNNPRKTPYNDFYHFVNKQEHDKNDNLVSAMAYAIAHENIELVKLLIKYGANLRDTTDSYVIIHKLGRVTKDLGIITPLCLAVIVGNIKIVELLLQNGANAGHNDPLSIALENNSLEIAELLINYGRTITEFQYNNFMEHALNNNDIKMAEFILKNSKNVKDTDKYISPLSIALKKQSKDMVKLLISYGLDPYETEYVSRISPLEMAEEMGGDWGILLVGKDKFEEYKKQRERERREKEQERERKEKERKKRWEWEWQRDREQYEEPKSASLPDKKYFEIPTEGTIEEKWKNIKKQFLKLSLKHHPDKGGNVDKFKEMSNEFDAIKEYMRITYPDKIDVFHGGKRKQTKRRGGRNKLTGRSKLTGHKLTQRKSMKKRR